MKTYFIYLIIIFLSSCTSSPIVYDSFPEIEEDKLLNFSNNFTVEYSKGINGDIVICNEGPINSYIPCKKRLYFVLDKSAFFQAISVESANLVKIHELVISWNEVGGSGGAFYHLYDVNLNSHFSTFNVAKQLCASGKYKTTLRNKAFSADSQKFKKLVLRTMVKYFEFLDTTISNCSVEKKDISNKCRTPESYKPCVTIDDGKDVEVLLDITFDKKGSPTN